MPPETYVKNAFLHTAYRAPCHERRWWVNLDLSIPRHQNPQARSHCPASTGQTSMTKPKSLEQVICLPEIVRKFREHALAGNYVMATRYQKESLGVINSILDQTEDRSRRAKWTKLVKELDEQLTIVRV